jgi:hypothetical protein
MTEIVAGPDGKPMAVTRDLLRDMSATSTPPVQDVR